MSCRVSSTLVESCLSVVLPPAERRRVFGGRASLSAGRAGFTPLETARSAGLLGAQARARSLTGFTLIELLVVIAIVAILSVVVILVLNPAELVRQARDSNRLQDLGNINTALNLFQTDTGGTLSMGLASTTYVSIPDPLATSTAGTNCASLGLPGLPSGWSYHCAASSTYRLVNGTGWIPVDLTVISFKSPLALLPVDPVNQTSSGSYYAYIPGGSWVLASLFESQRYLAKSAAQDGGYDPGRYEVGTDLSLVAKAEGLVGWWTFDEGSGGTATDSSGNGNGGTWNGTGTHYAGGKVGTYAGQFNGTDDYVDMGTNNIFQISIANGVTWTAWIKTNTTVHRTVMKHGAYGAYSPRLAVYSSQIDYFYADGANSSPVTISDNNWHFVTYIGSGSIISFYVDGISRGSGATTSGNTANVFKVGQKACSGCSDTYFIGLIDDVRVYNRALSAAEVTAMYNATK